MKNSAAFISVLLTLLTACSPATPGSSTPVLTELTPIISTAIAEGGGADLPLASAEPPTAIPTLGPGMPPTELKYRVLDEFPDFFFCDPDLYPIARQDEAVLAQERFPELQANQQEFRAILSHNGLSGLTTFTDEQKLLLYREHKKLSAIYFDVVGDQYQFQIQTGSEGQQGTLITATIDANGSINILQREQSFPSCPICLAAGTLIDTPRGAVRVEALRVGDPVWTMNEAGERVSAILLQTGSVRVSASHHVIHVKLEDGRELWASPGHPTVEGRGLGDLRIGDILDHAQIIQLERVPYKEVFTFDILPAGETGFYWANGILLGSTLAR